MNKQSLIKNLFGIIFCIIITGCATPQAARDLAQITSTNASLVETQIVNFNESSEDIYKDRVAAAEKLFQAIERARTKQDAYFEVANSAAKIANTSKKSHYGTVVTEIRKVSSVIQARQAEALAKREQFRVSALADYKKLDKAPKELSIIATNLSSLSEVESDAAQLESLKNFFTSILDGLEDSSHANDNTAGNDAGAGELTSSLIDTLKSNTEEDE